MLDDANDINKIIYDWIEEYHAEHKYQYSYDKDATYSYIFNKCVTTYGLPANYINYVIRAINTELLRNPFSVTFRRYITGRISNELEYKAAASFKLDDAKEYFSQDINSFLRFCEWCKDILVFDNNQTCEDATVLYYAANCIRNLVRISNTNIELVRSKFYEKLEARLLLIFRDYDNLDISAYHVYIENIVNMIKIALFGNNIDIQIARMEELKTYIFDVIDHIFGVSFESSWINSNAIYIDDIKHETLYDIFALLDSIICDIYNEVKEHWNPDKVKETISLCYTCTNLIGYSMRIYVDSITLEKKIE